jgi:hypothetical protein
VREQGRRPDWQSVARSARTRSRLAIGLQDEASAEPGAGVRFAAKGSSQARPGRTASGRPPPNGIDVPRCGGLCQAPRKSKRYARARRRTSVRHANYRDGARFGQERLASSRDGGGRKSRRSPRSAGSRRFGSFSKILTPAWLGEARGGAAERSASNALDTRRADERTLRARFGVSGTTKGRCRRTMGSPMSSAPRREGTIGDKIRATHRGRQPIRKRAKAGHMAATGRNAGNAPAAGAVNICPAVCAAHDP